MLSVGQWGHVVPACVGHHGYTHGIVEAALVRPHLASRRTSLRVCWKVIPSSELRAFPERKGNNRNICPHGGK